MKLICQECGGAGGYIEPVLDYGQGPWFDCGWCLGTGEVTPTVRGYWLAWKRQLKRDIPPVMGPIDSAPLKMTPSPSS